MNSLKRILFTLFIVAASALNFYAQEPAAPIIAPAANTTSDQIDEAGHRANEEKASDNAQSPATQNGAQQDAKPTWVFPTRSERFHRYVRSTVGPFSLLNAGISAGINQWRDNPEEWEQGASGYGKRLASSFGRNAIQQTVIYGLDSAMGLDTGFRKSQRKGFGPRMKDALAANITSRTRSGKRVFSVPRVAGVYTSAFISTEAWYPDRYDYKDALRSGTRSLLTGFGLNLVREFIFSW